MHALNSETQCLLRPSLLSEVQHRDTFKNTCDVSIAGGNQSEALAGGIGQSLVGNFDPAVIGNGWKILHDESDARADGIESLDLAKVRLETCLRGGESYIDGETWINRLRRNKYRRLGGKAFLTCWECRNSLPTRWEESEDLHERSIYFDGTLLMSLRGDRYTLGLCFEAGVWHKRCVELYVWRNTGDFSAVLV